MAMQILDADKVSDILDAFALETAGVKGLISVMEDIVLEGTTKNCTLDVNDPQHPDQQLHALVVAIRRQLGFAETLVNSITMSPAAS